MGFEQWVEIKCLHKIISFISSLGPCMRLHVMFNFGCTTVSGGRTEDPQLHNDPKQSHAGVDESEHADHQTAGKVAPDNQQHSEMEHECHQIIGEVVLDDQQQEGENLACAEPKPVKKERSKRFRNWSEDESSILLDCKKGGGFWKKRKQGSADWIAIPQEIESTQAFQIYLQIENTQA